MSIIPDTATDKMGEHTKDEVQSGKLLIGKTVFSVSVRFGTIPLEAILKNRILNSLKGA